MSKRRDFLKSAVAYSAVGVAAATISNESKAGSVSSTSSIANVSEIMLQNPTFTATDAVKAAVDIVNAAHGGMIYFPPGTYTIQESIIFSKSWPIEIVGSGFSSIINWSFDDHLFQWVTPSGATSSTICDKVTFRDLKIVSVGAKASTSSAIFCDTTTSKCYFDHLLFSPQNGSSSFSGSAISMTGIADSATINDCIFWMIEDTAIKIGRGSEIRVCGGRIVGVRNGTSIGIHLTGGNGGVHVSEVDIIQLHQGILVQNLIGQGNRELFITHSSIDSCWRGLNIYDNLYTSIAGCWAASCDHDNIHVAPGYPTALLTIAGGTIFNAGALPTATDPAGKNGLVINSGSFTLNGVIIRNNQGKGVWVPNGTVKGYVISGCKINNNGQGALLNGTSYIVSNNVFSQNSSANSFNGTGNLVANNLGA